MLHKLLVLFIFIAILPVKANAQSVQEVQSCNVSAHGQTVQKLEVFKQIGELFLIRTHVMEGTSKHKFLSIIEFQDNECITLYSDTLGDALPISQLFEREQAIQIYKAWTEFQGNIEEIQKFLDRGGKVTELDGEALKSLGLKVSSKNYGCQLKDKCF